MTYAVHIAAGALGLVSGFVALYARTEASLHMLTALPMLVFEMSPALWLTIKGVATPARTQSA